MRDRARLCLTMAASVSAACAGRAPAAQATAVPVVVAVAARKDVPVQVQAIGTVEPFSTVTVKPQVGGVIDTVHFREGADVRAGDLLFTIDRRPFQAAVRQVESARARDAAQLKNAEAEARRAEDGSPTMSTACPPSVRSSLPEIASSESRNSSKSSRRRFIFQSNRLSGSICA